MQAALSQPPKTAGAEFPIDILNLQQGGVCRIFPLHPVSADLPVPWSEKEIRRFQLREGLFKRRGASAPEAERLAELTIARDRDHDERRMCIECENLQRDGGCFAARQGHSGATPRYFAPVQTLLQRCDNFAWQKP